MKTKKLTIAIAIVAMNSLHLPPWKLILFLPMPKALQDKK